MSTDNFEKYPDYYKLTVNSFANYDNRPIYIVSVINSKRRYNIYIDKKSFAIVAAEITIKQSKFLYNEKTAKKYRYKNKRVKFCMNRSSYYLIKYKKIENKRHLNYVHTKNKTIVYNNKDTVIFEDKCDFLVNKIITKNVKKFRRSIKPNQDIYSKGITDKKIFNNPNKILDTKKEEIIRNRILLKTK